MVFLALSGKISTYIRKFQYQTLKKVMHQLRIMIILMSGVRLYIPYTGTNTILSDIISIAKQQRIYHTMAKICRNKSHRK